MADDRPASPTPEEREKLDREAKAKEDEEQAKLPYKWTQTIGDLDLTAPIPANLKGRDLDVKITKTSLKAGVKGQEPIIDVCRLLHHHFDTPSNLSGTRALSPTPSTSTNPPGHSRAPSRAKNSPSTSTRPTRWSGGPTS
jgi:hypothetical protein